MKSSELSFAGLRLRFGKYLRAHHISRAGLIAAGLGAAALFFVVGAGIRLLVGPVSLGPFSSTLSDAIAQALPGVTVKYDQAAIEWSRDEGRVELAILGARVFDADGRIIAQAPKAEIDLAARPFIEGKIEVKRITLVGVQLTLVRTRDGGLRLGVGKDSSERDFLTNITDAITATNSKTSSLQVFAVRSARVAFLDEVTGLFVVAPRADVMIQTAGANIAATLDADVEISGRPARVRASLLLPPRKGPVKGDVEITGLDIGALGANARAFSLVKGIALSVDMSASFAIDHGAHLASADFGADAHGAVGFPGLVAGPIQVRSARVVGRYDGSRGRLLVDDALLKSDHASAHLTGGATFNYDENHALSRVGFDAAVDNAQLNMPGTFTSPVQFGRIALRGGYLPSTNDLIVDHFSVVDGALSADGAGKVTLVPGGQSPAVEVKGSVGELTVKDLLHFWPLTVGAGARTWISENIFAGKVGPLVLEAHIPSGALDQVALPDGALSLTFPIVNAEANYVRGLTHLTMVNGTAKLTGDTFAGSIASAKIGPLAVGKANVVIPGLHLPGTIGDISAHVDGSMTDLLLLIDQKPLGYPSKFGIDPRDTKGSAGVDLSVLVPMRKDVAVDDVRIAVKAIATNFDIALGTRGRLSNGTINFDVDNDHLAAQGTAAVADSQVTLSWNENFRPSSTPTTRISATGTLDDSARQALRLNTGSVLSGPVGVQASLTGRHGHFDRADVSMDLTPARLAVDLIGIEKPAGMKASAQLAVSFAPGSVVRGEDVIIVSQAGTIHAVQTFAPDGSLQSLDLPQVRFGPANDFSFSLSKSVAGSDVVVRGRSLDGSRIAHQGSNSAKGSETQFDGPYRISARLDRLALREGVSVAPFALDMTGNGDQVSTMGLSGSLGHSASVSGTMSAGASARRLNATTDDAGTLMRGVFGLTGMRGGKLDIAASLPQRASERGQGDSPDFQGVLTLRDATLVNQPFLARLLGMASFIGIGNILQGKGIAIDKLEVPFSSKNQVISVHDAIVSGPTIGATADGYIDRPQNTVALKGSLVPVVGIDFNKILGAIPLVGDIFVSKKGEGIFGVTYSVKGNADEPSLTVNPLAFLTPGILRRIFQGRMPNASQAPTNLQSQSPPATPLPAQASSQTSPRPKMP